MKGSVVNGGGGTTNNKFQKRGFKFAVKKVGGWTNGMSKNGNGASQEAVSLQNGNRPPDQTKKRKDGQQGVTRE